MPVEKTPSWLNLERVGKLILYAFAFGVGWNRLEYKMDQHADKLLKKIDEHIITDGFEKQIHVLRMNQLEGQISVLSSRTDELEYFIKPDAPEIKKKKYR